MQSALCNRLLLFFELGGVMSLPPDQAVMGVQNYLETAAQRLRPATPIKFVISSRTDSGVHALCNSAHIDVERPAGKPPLPESSVMTALNRYLRPEPIRILGARHVPDTFHARFSARSRTYLYRAVTGCSRPSEVPVFERNLAWATFRGHLNLSAMQEAAEFLQGTHDFSTFSSRSPDGAMRNPVKTLLRAEVRPAPGFLSHYDTDSVLRFWELEFQSKSFLYRQVRRMVGALVAVGQNRLQPHHVKELLKARDSLAYPQHTMAPAAGLFLKDVEYCEDDLQVGQTETK